MRSLYICYLPISEPLVETQVLAYLRGLASEGHMIHLLTFEDVKRPHQEREQIAREMGAQGISWTSLRYHKRPSLLATAYDTLIGIIRGVILIRRERIEVVHARVHVPGAMALALRRLSGVKVIFDIRGLMAEEYVDAGRWKQGSIPFRIVKWVERRLLREATAVIVLTERAKQFLFGLDQRTSTGGHIEVIPSCADVEHIAASAPARDAVRRELGWENELIFLYLGKFTGWYMAEEMARFFATALRNRPESRFLILTQSDHMWIKDALAAEGATAHTSRILKVPPHEVGRHIAAADIGISFIRPSPSKIASSPTKVGEYLAGGKPIIVTTGIGDVDQTLESHRCGVALANHDVATYERAFEAVEELRRDPEVAARCRAAAEEEFSLTDVGIPRYRKVYATVEQTLRSRQR